MELPFGRTLSRAEVLTRNCHYVAHLTATCQFALYEAADRWLNMSTDGITGIFFTKKKGKEELYSFFQNIKRDKGENYFERYYRNGSSPWFREIK
jgi:hypothetical protein